MTPDELQAVVDVWVRSRWEAEPWLEERMSYSADDNLAHFRDVIAAQNEVWVAVSGEEVTALLAMAEGVVDQLFVDPAHRRRGIGRSLLDLAKTRSPSGLTLYTHQRNERARAFYEAQGFRAIRFGVSPEPEREPDVTYAWSPTSKPTE